jgi:peptidoglycan hydrolase CwlO-like protein
MRANRGRFPSPTLRLAGILLAVLVLSGIGPGAGAGTRSDLARARARLAELETRIKAAHDRLATLQGRTAQQRAKLEALQGELNRLAAKITDAQGRLEETQQRIAGVRGRLIAARHRYDRLKGRLNLRARMAYEGGPGSSLELILGATSLVDLSDRLEYMDQLSRSDADLSNEVQNRANELSARKADLERLLAKQAEQLAALKVQQQQLNEKFAQQQSIYDALSNQAAEAARLSRQLANDQASVTALVNRLQKRLKAEELAHARVLAAQAAKDSQAAGAVSQSGGGSGGSPSGSNPLGRCPVAGPHAFSDSFGAPRYGGGYHPHAGIDLMAPLGTPVVAPFSGSVSADPNGLGGNAIIEHGSSGWTYGAHLSSYGATGSVSIGTVIGHVGNTGDARGGPYHLHFEWHPNVIPANPYRSAYGYTVINGAIDPYPFLTQVC